MKKILFTINFLTNGGPTRVVQNIIKSLNREEYSITVLTLIDENNEEIVKKLEKNDVKVISLKYGKSLKSILKDKKKIIEIINNENASIIHTHGIVSTFIVSDNRVKGKKITTIHNNIFEDYKYTYGTIKGLIYSWIHIIQLKKFDKTICCSKTSYDVLKNKVRRITYIRNGIDVDFCNNKEMIRKKIRKELNIGDSAIVFTYGGVINDRKRVVELVEMFTENHSTDEFLLIVGDGPKMEIAKEKADNNVIFTGFMTNILDYFCASDIYISNSSSEGFSISIIEALRFGLICFLSDIPSHAECFDIDTEYNVGLTFNNSNFSKQKEEIKKIYKNRNIKNIVEFQEKYLSSKTMTTAYEKEYKKLGE